MNSEIGNLGKILDLPDISQLDLKKNHGIFVKIGIVSETTGFFINRNNEATEITSENFFGEERVVIPAAKWRGAERSYLLSEMRKIKGAIPEEYSRNMVDRKNLLKNPSSLIYGDSSTGKSSEAAGIASRVFYDWSYSFEPLSEISVRLTHNSLSDSGAILQEEGGKVKSNAIYNIPYIKPGVKFVRFLSLENVSTEMLALVIVAIVGTTRYGARTAILGDNVSNKIVAIGKSKMETPISSYSVMVNSWKKGVYAPEEEIVRSMKEAYGENLITGENLDQILKTVIGIRRNKEIFEDMCKVITTKIENDWAEFWGEDLQKGKKGSKDRGDNEKQKNLVDEENEGE